MSSDNAKIKAEHQTELEILKAHLKESEHRENHLRKLIDGLPQIIFEIDVDGQFTYVNDFALQAYGYTKEDIEKGLNIRETLHLDNLDQAMRNIQRALHGTPSPGNEYMALRKDGSEFPVRVFSQGIFKNGHPVGARGVVVDITAAKQTEEALLKSESYYRALFENTGSAMVIFDDDLTIHSCNSQFETLSGYSAREINGKMQWLNFVDLTEKDRIRHYHNLRTTQNSSAPKKYDFIFLANGNIRKRVHISVEFMPDTKDRVCSLIDITEREQAREALRKSEERYELVVRGAHDGIWDWDLVSGEVYFSPRYKSILGYEDDEFPNVVESWKNAIHPDDFDYALAANQECIDRKVYHFQVEIRLRHKDGSYRWILGRGTGVADATGKTYRLAGTHTDITDRKKTEDSLKKSEQQYREIFANANDGIFQSTPEGRFITANAAMARIMGYDSPETLVNSINNAGVDSYANPEDRKLFLEAMKKHGKLEQYEIKLKRRDGTLIWVAENVRTVYDKSGNYLYYEGFLQDITQRKLHESTTRAMYAISKAISTTNDLQHLYATIHAILGEVIDATNFFIGVIDPEEDRILLPKSSGGVSLKPSSAETGRRLTPKMVRMGTA